MKHFSLLFLSFSLLASAAYSMKPAEQPIAQNNSQANSQTFWDRTVKGVAALTCVCLPIKLLDSHVQGACRAALRCSAWGGPEHYAYRQALHLGLSEKLFVSGSSFAIAGILATKAVQGKGFAGLDESCTAYAAPLISIGTGCWLLGITHLLWDVDASPLFYVPLAASGALATGWGTTKIFQNLRAGK